MDRKVKIGYYILFVSLIMVTVGWASLNTSLDINIESLVKGATDIRVTGVIPAFSSAGGSSNFANYTVNAIDAEVVLPNADSTVTYAVTITNFDSQIMGLANIISSTDRIIYTVRDKDGNLFDFGTKICDDINPSLCDLGSVKDLYITISYSEFGYDELNTTISFSLLFNFLPMYTITYNDVDGEYPTEIMQGNTLDIIFDRDVNLTITDGINTYEQDVDYTLIDNNLIFPNVSSNLVITVERNYDASEVSYSNSLSYDNCETVECALDELYRESQREVKIIKYDGLSSSYVRNVLSGRDVVIDFTTEVNIPSLKITSKTKTYVEGVDYTYENGILTIPAISENLLIKGMLYDASEVSYSNALSMCDNLACAMDEINANINSKVIVIKYHNVDGSNYPRNLLSGSTLNLTTNFARSGSVNVLIKSKTRTYIKDVDYAYNNGNLVVPNVEESLDVYFTLYDATEVSYSNSLSKVNCDNLACAMDEVYEGINQPKIAVIKYHNIDGSSYPRNLFYGSDLNFNTNFSNVGSVTVLVKSKTRTYIKDVDYTYTNGQLVVPNVGESLDIYFTIYDASEVGYTNSLSNNNCETVSCALNEIYSSLR